MHNIRIAKVFNWEALIILIALLPLFNLINAGSPVTHDGQDHIARIANFYQSLHEGNIVPRWAGNLNWGYGHPVLMFLYPLPSYLASLLHWLGFSLVDSVKLLFATAYIVSMLAMYWWVKLEWGKIPGFIAALLYGFAPYRFVDMYVRGALGEHVSFIFLPLIMLSIIRLSHGHLAKWGILVSLATAGLLLSHNAVSIMFIPVIIIYIIYCFSFHDDSIKFIILTVGFILLGFLMSAFFWLPALLEGKYTLRNIVLEGDIISRFVPFSAFIYSPWSYGGSDQLTKQIGIVHWAAIAGSIVSLHKTRQQQIRWYLGVGIVVFFVSLFMMTRWSYPIWKVLPLLITFQFPWRILTISVFIVSALCGPVMSVLCKKISRTALILIILPLLLFTNSMWQAKTYTVMDESFYKGIYYGTTDTGESSPIWSTRFMENRAARQIEVAEGEAIIKKVKYMSKGGLTIRYTG